MAKMVDSEGVALPDDYSKGTFDLRLNGPFEDHFDNGVSIKSEEPILRDFSIFMWIPTDFQTDQGTVYDSFGMLRAPFRDLLEEYLLKEVDNNSVEVVEEFAAWLRDYADRMVKTLEK